MAERRPLVVISGQARELPAGDTLPGIGGAVTQSDTAPTIPHANPLWLNSLTLSMYYQYNDGTSTQWVDVSVPPSSMGGGAGQVQFNQGGLPGGAGRVLVDDNDLVLSLSDTPAAPAADGTKLFCRSIAGRMLPAFFGSDGLDTTLQPFFARNKIGLWSPPGNSTTVPGVFGMAAATAVGTAAAVNVATTNKLTRMRRLRYTSSSTAGNLCGQRWAAAQLTMGGTAGLGGFTYLHTWGIGDASLQAVARTFVGMSSSVAAPTNVSPATLTNSIGMGHAEYDTTMRLYYGGSAAQTPINLGASFPVDNTTPYELALYSPPGVATTCHWMVTNIATGAKASGTITGGSTILPQETTFLAPRAWRSNNTAAAIVGIDISSVYTETDY